MAVMIVSAFCNRRFIPLHTVKLMVYI